VVRRSFFKEKSIATRRENRIFFFKSTILSYDHLSLKSFSCKPLIFFNLKLKKKKIREGFPGGSVVKNLPANA